jgi:carbonic anhydrase/acetyltransferase-like protein (isoleucine patch superfamily)
MLPPMLISHDGIRPRVDPSAYVHSSAQVIGDVHIGPQSSVWFNAVIRGDVFHVRIGARTNVQDNSTIHVTTSRWATIVGDDVTIGHNVVLHGCTIGNRCLIGIGAIVLDGCEIGDDCIVAAGSVLTPGTKVEPGQLVLGSPARVARRLEESELEYLRASAGNYVANAEKYRRQGIE